MVWAVLVEMQDAVLLELSPVLEEVEDRVAVVLPSTLERSVAGPGRRLGRFLPKGEMVLVEPIVIRMLEVEEAEEVVAEVGFTSSTTHSPERQLRQPLMLAEGMEGTVVLAVLRGLGGMGALEDLPALTF